MVRTWAGSASLNPELSSPDPTIHIPSGSEWFGGSAGSNHPKLSSTDPTGGRNQLLKECIQLQKEGNQLQDGANQLREGSNQLQEDYNQLQEGANQLEPFQQSPKSRGRGTYIAQYMASIAGVLLNRDLARKISCFKSGSFRMNPSSILIVPSS